MQFCSSDWEELRKDLQNNEGEEEKSNIMESFQRWLSNEDSVEQNSGQLELTE